MTLVEVTQNIGPFRARLVKFYVDQNRVDDAEKELRATAADDPNAGVHPCFAPRPYTPTPPHPYAPTPPN